MASSLAKGQRTYDRTGYYGDNFSLQGALELFKNANSLEDFERRLNTQDAWINNLDLDNDNRIDFIRVEHRRYDQNFHAIVLQATLGQYDLQDIAVIEIEQVANRRVDLQIVGDEDVFGNEIFIEPYGDNERQIYTWPIVQSILYNTNAFYASPYSYYNYPTWWSPWNTVAWNVYYPRVVGYHQHYRVINQPRFVTVHNYYKPNRVYNQNVLHYSNDIRQKQGHEPINRPRNSTREQMPANENRSQQPKNDTSRTYDGTNNQHEHNTDRPNNNSRNQSQENRKSDRPQQQQQTPRKSNVQEKSKSVPNAAPQGNQSSKSSRGKGRNPR